MAISLVSGHEGDLQSIPSSLTSLQPTYSTHTSFNTINYPIANFLGNSGEIAKFGHILYFRLSSDLDIKTHPNIPPIAVVLYPAQTPPLIPTIYTITKPISITSILGLHDHANIHNIHQISIKSIYSDSRVISWSSHHHPNQFQSLPQRTHDPTSVKTFVKTCVSLKCLN